MHLATAASLPVEAAQMTWRGEGYPIKVLGIRPGAILDICPWTLTVCKTTAVIEQWDLDCSRPLNDTYFITRFDHACVVWHHSDRDQRVWLNTCLGLLSNAMYLDDWKKATYWGVTGEFSRLCRQHVALVPTWHVVQDQPQPVGSIGGMVCPDGQLVHIKQWLIRDGFGEHEHAYFRVYPSVLGGVFVTAKLMWYYSHDGALELHAPWPCGDRGQVVVGADRLVHMDLSGNRLTAYSLVRRTRLRMSWITTCVFC